MKNPHCGSLRVYALMIVCFVGASSTSQASTNSLIAAWNQVNTATTGFPLAAAQKSVAVQSASLNYSNLFTINDSRNIWSDPNTNATVNPATDPYLDYQVVLAPAQIINPGIFFVGGYGVADGQTRLALRSSLDGYAAVLATLVGNGSYTNYTIDVSALGPISGTVDFRLYPYSTPPLFATNHYGTFATVQSTSFYGTNYNSLQGSYNVGIIATVVPEPSTIGMMVLGSALALLGRCRRK